MNVLFYTSFKVHSTMGGTERTTISVAKGLKQYYNFHCYSIYYYDASTPKEECFDAEYCIKGEHTYENIRQIVVNNKIEAIIDQGNFRLVKGLRNHLKGINCKIIFAYHFRPGWEKNYNTFHFYIDRWKSAPDIIRFAKRTFDLVVYPFTRINYLRQVYNNYKDVYKNADAVVLLSKGFIKPFKKLAKIEDSKGIYVIPNSLSFNYFFPKEQLNKKKKIILIVSRLDELQKRISLAIKIWNEVKKHPEAEGWRLNIVGHGDSLKLYQKLISKLKVPDIFLLGRQIPNNYYKESSIFLMTSKSEGWGLTLTEAQQMGVVPIAFDSYESIHDIIKDKHNGMIIPEGNINEFIEKLIWLMSNDLSRLKMAECAISDSHHFENKKIVLLWHKLMNIIINNKQQD